MTARRLSRSDFFAAATLFLVTLVVFGAGASRLGFYTDDNNWLYNLPKLRNWHELWHTMRDYMPGRNLHPLWHYLFYQTTGNNPVAHLPVLHLWAATIDGLVVATFFLLLRLAPVPATAAMLAAGLFAFCPTHGETHFWLESLPMNLLSTLFLLFFGITTLALGRGRRAWWLWLLDAGAFFAALFTYDQVLLLLALLAALRLVVVWKDGSSGRLTFTLLHAPYLAGGFFFVWLRLTRGGGPVPRAGNGFGSNVAANVRHSWADTFGFMGQERLTGLLAKATLADWVVAAVVALVLATLALRALAEKESSPLGIVFILAAAAGLLAYLPAWLWFVSPRHHYLPTVGFFAGVAVVLAALLRFFDGRLLRGVLCLAVGLVIAVEAGACRGESRFWEEGFQAKRALFAEVESDLAGKEFLVMENFPHYHGTAQLLAGSDVTYGPQLLARDPSRFLTDFKGVLGSAPAPDGRFLATHVLDGRAEFVHSDGSNAVVLRFLGWDGARFRYAKNPSLPLPYDVVDTACVSQPASFAVHEARAKRQGAEVLLSLDYGINLKPDTRLAAIVNYFHWDHLEPWGEPDTRRSLIMWPVMLASPAAAGGARCSESLRLHRFPRASPIRLDFYATSRHGAPTLLGRSEVAVEP
jgi:hypothetical protein